MKNILIVTNPEDIHAVLVGESLRRKGAAVTLWQSSEFPNRATETVTFDDSESVFEIEGMGGFHREKQIDTVWLRRPQLMWGVTPVEEEDRQFTELQCEIFREGLLSCVAPDAFWVNPPGAAKQVRSKIRQHHEALRVGLRLPKSVYTNDPKVIRRFIRACKEVVYKPLYPAVWGEAGERWGIYTTRITEADLVKDQLLQAVPGIYQQIVPKDHELRITAMGHHLFAAKVLSQETERGKLDWRLAWDELRIEATELDADIATRCRSLMERLGIVFGCFDFIVTPSGEHIFLEVNQMGQFGFIERYCGLPLIDAISEFLIQGRVDFHWNAQQIDVRLDDIEDIAQGRLEDLARHHLTRPDGVIYPHLSTLI